MSENITPAMLAEEYIELLGNYPPRHCVTMLSERHRLSQKTIKNMLAAEDIDVTRKASTNLPAMPNPEETQLEAVGAIDTASVELVSLPDELTPWYGDTLERIQQLLDMVQAGDSKLYSDYIVAASHELLRQAALS